MKDISSVMFGKLRLLVLCGLALLTFSCWKSAEPIITQEEVEKILGVPAKLVTPSNGKCGEVDISCRYKFKLASSSETYELVIISLDPKKRNMSPRMVFDVLKTDTANDRYKVEPIAGIGDEAFWDRGRQAVYVLKGDGIINVYFPTVTSYSGERHYVDSDFARTAAIKVATIIVSRLK